MCETRENLSADSAQIPPIRSCISFRDANHGDYAWSNLRQYKNPELLIQKISALHNVPRSQIANVRKQAMQIRHCLSQAEEYRMAANAVGLATKPNLQYYSAMSLALAELLLKHDGNYSLDKARASHRHHGLTLAADKLPSPADDLQTAAAKLRAVPMQHADGSRYGTFSLWHETAREMPVVGLKNLQYAQGQTQRPEVIWGADNAPLPSLKRSGISLLECFELLPGMVEYLNRNRIQSSILRGRLTYTERVGNSPTSHTELILHPGPADFTEAFWNNTKLSPVAVNYVDFVPLTNGGIFTIEFGSEAPGFRLIIPAGAMFAVDEVRFWTQPQPLNEFGFLYVALFIVGSYARYYPDRWLLDLESSSPLAMAISHLLELFERRAGLLVLSELDRRYHVPQAA